MEMLEKFRKKISQKAETQPPTPEPLPSPTTARHDSSQSNRSSSVIRERRRGFGTKEFLARSRKPSQLSPAISRRTLSPISQDGKDTGFGLRMVYRPAAFAPVDIIFVHGLGGHSQKTWSKNHDPNMFWPGLWLPFEKGIGEARIFSFGYNANFRPGSGMSFANISDFAKELLHEMAFGTDEDGEDFEIGRVPIIFVVHSMGGLVMKKAYLLGQNDENYESIIRAISGVIFLATPHRGSGLAEVLNKILAAMFQAPKHFVNDLNKGSLALEELNESFRHVALKLSLCSFYETLATKIGVQKMVVVDKPSAILGYPKEISRPLVADHHDVCKYASPDDANYISVRNAIKSMVAHFRPKGMTALSNWRTSDAADITALLAITSAPEGDFDSFRRCWVPGTCEWALREPHIQVWLDDVPEPCVVWYSAPPGSGKSVLSSYLINHLRDKGQRCQYFFFVFGDQTKRALNTCLRTMAYQLARDIPEYAKVLRDLSYEGVQVEKAEPVFIWQKLFESVLFSMEHPEPLYWVIDALDEAESPELLIELLDTLQGSKSFLRILIISRKTEGLSIAFDRLSDSIPISLIEKFGRDHNMGDIRSLVEKNIKHMRGGDEFKKGIMEQIINRSQGNFLWVRLVLEELVSCHMAEDVQEVLDEIPSDMNLLYERMETAITKGKRKGDRRVAKALLQWVICARRALTLDELTGALPGFLDLKRTIQDVCGQFVVVDDSGTVSMVHQTAREYLTTISTSEIAVDSKQAHEELCRKTVITLLDPELRPMLMQRNKLIRKTDPFVIYAATSWTYHLRHGNIASDESLDTAVKILNSPTVLVWIHALALVGHLDVLVEAAKVFTAICNTNSEQNASKVPIDHQLENLGVLKQWSIDLVKVVGKFSKHLLLEPQAIYNLIPPICPTKSNLYRQFYQKDSANIYISGVGSSTWNDNLARIILPNGDRCWKVTSAGKYLAVLGSSGTTYLWDSYSFAEICILCHQQPVTAMCLNRKGDRLATYGLQNTKIWSIPAGELLGTAANIPEIKAIAIEFADGDTKIYAGMDDRVIRCIKVNELESGWQLLNDAPSRDGNDSSIEGSFTNSPVCVAFNRDQTQVGISYRAFPLTVWSVTDNRYIGRCKRAKDLGDNGGRPSVSWFGVDRFVWNPTTGHVLGAYKDGCLFKWHPITDEVQEIQSTADELAISPDGKLVVTSDSNGTITLWSFASMSKIYRLSSADLVTGLAFSADSMRFFDLRGRSVNSWEPNSLIRFSENDNLATDFASEEERSTSEARLAQFEAVTALAVAPQQSLYCFGNEEGIVYLCDALTGKQEELTSFPNFQCVSDLAWSVEGLVAAADLSGEITIKQLVSEPNTALPTKLLPTPKIDLSERGIQQLLLNDQTKSLLVISPDFAQVWSIQESKITASRPFPDGGIRKWLQHPTQARLFLGFGSDDVQVYNWQDLAELGGFTYHEAQPPVDSEASSIAEDDKFANLASLKLDETRTSQVIKAIATQDGKHTLVQIKDISARGAISKRVLIFDNSDFERTENSIAGAMMYHYIPQKLLPRVDIPLGILSGFRFVFLDQDLWLCTLNLNTLHDEEALRRHYFIPRDWATTESLELCCMMDDGTVLCPKDDRVALISADLGFSRL